MACLAGLLVEAVKGMAPRADAKWKLALHDKANAPFAAFDIQTIPFIQETLVPAEQREAAALGLVGVNWQIHPQVVPTLLKSARQDPAGMVRAACVRSLAQLDAHTIPVLATSPEIPNCSPASRTWLRFAAAQWTFVT